MRILDWQLTLTLLVALTIRVMSEKDSNYYPGYANPNVKKKMYWNDAVNVLEDIDQFRALYIKYHHCVWSPYGDGEDEDGVCFNGDNDGDGDGEDWYLGRTQCLKANVAYTLYGVLKSDDNDSWSGNHCRKKNYINSFFTTHGVESFAEPFGIDTTYANSYCTSSGNGNDDCGDDCNKNYEHNGMIYSDSTSTGTGCSSGGKFVIDKYKGSSCDGSYYQKTTDWLYDFNNEIEDLGCYKIYDSQVYERKLEEEDDEENGDNNEAKEGEEEENGEDGGDDGSLVFDILPYSQSCSISEYPRACPDPYRLKRKYNKASQKAARSHQHPGYRVKRFFSWMFLLVGLALLLLAVVMNRRTRRRMQMEASSKRSKRSSSSQDDRSRRSWKRFFKRGSPATRK